MTDIRPRRWNDTVSPCSHFILQGETGVRDRQQLSEIIQTDCSIRGQTGVRASLSFIRHSSWFHGSVTLKVFSCRWFEMAVLLRKFKLFICWSLWLRNNQEFCKAENGKRIWCLQNKSTVLLMHVWFYVCSTREDKCFTSFDFSRCTFTVDLLLS